QQPEQQQPERNRTTRRGMIMNTMTAKQKLWMVWAADRVSRLKRTEQDIGMTVMFTAASVAGMYGVDVPPITTKKNMTFLEALRILGPLSSLSADGINAAVEDAADKLSTTEAQDID